MTKRLYKFKVTDPESLMEFCPNALEKLDPVIRYKQNYAVIAKLLAASELTGQEIPGVEVLESKLPLLTAINESKIKIGSRSKL